MAEFEVPGAMTEKQRNNRRIRERVVDMYRQFVSEVDPKNVLDLLIEKRVISIHQRQEIANKETVIDRCRALLDHLFSCPNDESFIILKEALEDQYHWIVERIDHCETENETSKIKDAMSEGGYGYRVKTTFQKSAKGPVAIHETAPDGKYVGLENTGRKEEPLGQWSLKRNADGKDVANYHFADSFVIRAGDKIKLWAKGEKPPSASPLDVEVNQLWGVGANVVTTLINPSGEERATHTQKTTYG